MKKVSIKNIESLKNDGWALSDDSRDKIASQKDKIKLNEVAEALVKSVKRIAEASESIRHMNQNSNIARTLNVQITTIEELLSQVRKMRNPVSPNEPGAWQKIKFDVERNGDGFITRVHCNRVE